MATGPRHSLTCHTKTLGGVNADSAAAAAGLAATDAGLIAPVGAVKANFFNAPCLPVMTFTDGYLLFVFFRTIGSRVFRGH